LVTSLHTHRGQEGRGCSTWLHTNLPFARRFLFAEYLPEVPTVQDRDAREVQLRGTQRVRETLMLLIHFLKDCGCLTQRESDDLTIVLEGHHRRELYAERRRGDNTEVSESGDADDDSSVFLVTNDKQWLVVPFSLLAYSTISNICKCLEFLFFKPRSSCPVCGMQTGNQRDPETDAARNFFSRITCHAEVCPAEKRAAIEQYMALMCSSILETSNNARKWFASSWLPR